MFRHLILSPSVFWGDFLVSKLICLVFESRHLPLFYYRLLLRNLLWFFYFLFIFLLNFFLLLLRSLEIFSFKRLLSLLEWWFLCFDLLLTRRCYLTEWSSLNRLWDFTFILFFIVNRTAVKDLVPLTLFLLDTPVLSFLLLFFVIFLLLFNHSLKPFRVFLNILYLARPFKEL